jgi:hypothetical protein
MFKLAIVATTLLAVFGGGQPVFAQAAMSEPGAYAFYHPDADVLNAGRPTFSDSVNASANERDTRIDNHARAPQTLRDTIAALPLRIRPRPLRSSACMTEYLIAARAAIILWTNLAVMPAEIVFDAIEAELERRSVEQ